MASAISKAVSSIIVSSRVRGAQRGVAAALRRARGGRPTVHYFHEAGDPYSHLTAQVLPDIAARYAVEIVPHLVPAPEAAAAPEPERLAAYARSDAALLAEAHGLSMPAGAAPAPEAVREAERALAAALASDDFAASAVVVGEALWRGDPVPGEGGDAEAALAEGAALREKRGHYLGATFYFEGEWYWGIDRIPHLESRLAAFRDGAPVVRRLHESDAPPSAPGVRIDFFPSLRSPYTYLAAARMRRLAERAGADLNLRFVLPMVMRGLPVPNAKRLYIVRDTKREAERLGLPFGPIADPVGAGAERGLAVLHHALPAGRGFAFLESFLKGVWAEGLDAATDRGLAAIAERAGVDAATVAAGLADPSWREVAEANRAEMFELGLWGVPSFRVAGGTPRWGQDRLWAVERDLAAAGVKTEAAE